MTDQTQAPERVEAHENVAINTVEQAFEAVADWHGHICSQIIQQASFPLEEVNPVIVVNRKNEETGEIEELNVTLTSIEEKEAFKAGMREAYAYFAEMPFFSVEKEDK